MNFKELLLSVVGLAGWFSRRRAANEVAHALSCLE